MPEIDALKSKIDILRDDYKNLFYVFFAVASGSFAIIYKILISENPVYLIFLALFGLIGAIVLFVKMIHIRQDINAIQKRLEELP